MSLTYLGNGEYYVGGSGEGLDLLNPDFHILWFGVFLVALAIVLVVMEVKNRDYWILLLLVLYVTGVSVDLWVHQFIH